VLKDIMLFSILAARVAKVALTVTNSIFLNDTATVEPETDEPIMALAEELVSVSWTRTRPECRFDEDQDMG
jgi:hypothetical protein